VRNALMNGSIRRSLLTIAVSLFVCSLAFAAEPAPANKNSCLDCHSLLEENLKVTPEQFAQDVHAGKGLTCASCHGGDPNSDDKAMDKSAGFVGHIRRAQIPALCGKCHADAAYIRRFNPSLRTDQLPQYLTSVHGKKLAQGDEKVAVCTDCHGLHGIRAISDTQSSVHPLNVAKTCSRCHADREYMKSYSIPTDQFAGYSASVHQEALTVRGDLSAPTCTTCHGNHGASPPGVASVENVCSTCHALQAQLFDTSPHKVAFAAAGQPGCVTCHSNHRIIRPTDALLGPGPGSVCSNCHSPGDAGLQAAGQIRTSLEALDTKIGSSDQILKRAASSGMEVSDAQLELGHAKDSSTKARVTLHSFDPKLVQKDVEAGTKITDQAYQAGVQAMHERDYRRMGLGVSLAAILAVLIGLKLWISDSEKKHD